jgi:signal transduction histidine kinase
LDLARCDSREAVAISRAPQSAAGALWHDDATGTAEEIGVVVLGKVFRFTDWSVRRKLIALLVAASLVPLTAATMLDLRTSRARLRGGAAELLAAHADHLRLQLDTFHRDYELSIAKLARQPSVLALAGARDPAAAAAVHDVIDVHVAIDPAVRGVGVLDRNGKVIAATAPHLEGAVLVDRDYVRRALGGRAAISDVHVAEPELEAPAAIAYAAPVWGEEDGPVGVAVLWVRAMALWNLARGSNALVGPGSFAVVLDAHGIRIAHTSSDELVFHPAGALPPDERAALVAAHRFGADTGRLLDEVRPLDEAFARARAAAPDRSLFRTLAAVNQEWNYGVARRLAMAPWTICYLLPERLLDDQIAAMTRDAVILAAILIALALALGLWMAAMIRRPVVSLSAATSVIASGDLSARVPSVGGDELGRLCASFNAMAERIERDDAELRRSRDELEDRVAERTADLVRASLTEARARAALEASTARLELLARTAHELAAASGEADVVLELASRRLAEAIGGGCGIRLISDDGEWLEPSRNFYHRDPARHALGQQFIGTVRQPIGEGVGGQVARTGEPILIPELTPERVAAVVPAFRPLIEQLGSCTLMVLPLRSRERTIGAVNLLRDSPGQPYTVDDQRFAQEIADRAGLAIDNAVLVATLERRVAARTAALEQANHELEAFSYSVSHDLRAPLRTIDGFSHALLVDHGEQLDAEAQRYLERIRSATQRMAGLIDDLLNLARVARGALRWTAVSMTALAGQVAAELHRRDPGRATPIHVAPDVACRGDARLLAIVLENLLGNAWKFTTKHAAAEIWFGEQERDGGTVYYVRDTGAGFDMKYADKLFAPFHRLHAASDYEGVGVGLAIVQRIVSRHGGQIWAEAEVDRGATFYFTLGAPP